MHVPHEDGYAIKRTELTPDCEAVIVRFGGGINRLPTQDEAGNMNS